MADKILKVQQQQARKPEADWIAQNPVLRNGQLAYSSDKNNKYKIGDGKSKWSELSYVTYTPADIGVIGTTPTNGQVAVFDGTTGKIKSTGFTIAKSVPSNAIFTDTVYKHPEYAAKTSGLYKITVDSLGHVSAVTAVTKADITNLGIPGQDTNTTYGLATATTNGLIRIGYATSGKNYPVSLDNEGKAYVNVPWTDNNTTYSVASASSLGLIKIGYTATGKNYPVVLDSDNKAYVNVPWVDNNTVYTHPGYTARSSGLYKITVDNTGHISTVATVTKADITELGIPGQDTNTTYTVASDTVLGLIKVGYSLSGKNYPVELDTDGNAYVNVPWTDTNSIYTHPATSGNKHIPAGGASGQILRWSSDGTAVWGADNNTTYSTATASTLGLIKIGYAVSGKNYPVALDADGKAYVNVPWTDNNTVYTHPVTAGNKHIPAGGASGQILRWSADGTAVWGSDNNTTYNIFGAASASAAGSNGLVPAPAAGKQTSFLRGDGTWVVPTNTVYTHPTYTSKTSGLYKVTVDGTGHVSAVTNVTKDDITALGIPAQDTNTVYTHPTTSGNKHIPSGGSSGQILRWSADGTAVWGADNNTTYGTFAPATASAAGGTGLVPAPAAGKNTSFLRGDGTWVVPTNTTYGLATASANGLLSSGDFAKISKFTATEAGYLSGVTSNIQTQINNLSNGKVTVGTTAPTNKTGLWIDTGNGGVAKYNNGTDWIVVASTWG